MTMACLVLASGQSRRFGEGDKLMAELKGQALLAYCLDAASETGFDGLFVVCPDPDPRADLARSFGFDVIANLAPEQGQGASLALGARHILDKGHKAACVLLGDMPMITPDYLNALKTKSGQVDIIFSRIDGRDQPPAIFKGEALKALTKLSGDSGAQSLDLSGFKILRKDIDPELAIDFDQPADFKI